MSIISVNNLSKQYRIGQRQPYKTLRETLMNTIKSPVRFFNRNGLEEDNTIWALKDVSFEVKEGEVIGIIGRNGAGKTTLLKILSRVTEPTEGMIKLRGRVASLLEVGTGFHPELTGRENIFLNGSILGMTRQEIKSKFDEIVAFAEIEKFIDTPVKRYSSGMYVRLAFAVAAHLDPEILVVDEVLAVGDAQFQKKCLGKMEDVAKGGRTVLFVSHNMAAIRSLCQRVLLIEKGCISFEGEAQEAIDKYLDYNSSIDIVMSEDKLQKKANVYSPNQEVYFRCEEIALLDRSGQPRSEFKSNEEIIISIKYNCLKPVSKFHLVVTITTEHGEYIVGSDIADHIVSEGAYSIQPGIYQSQCVIPGDFFGEKKLFLDVRLMFHGEQHIVYKKILGFDVIFQGYNYSNYAISRTWEGYVRPRLDWQTVQHK